MTQICARCDSPTDRPVVVGQKFSASAGGATIYACPEHAASFPQQVDPFMVAGAMRRARQTGRAR